MLKRMLVSLFMFISLSFASDPITLDSLFKKQIGLRSIASVKDLYLIRFLKLGSPGESLKEFLVNFDL